MSDSPFKRYVTALYAAPGVAPACLLLQDQSGADVLLMLAAAYAATHLAAPLSEAEIVALAAQVAPWRTETIAPLRRVRRHLKTGWPGVDPEARLALRRDLATLELRAEWIEAEMIEAWLAARTPVPDPLPLADALRRLAPGAGAEADAARLLLADAAAAVRG